MQANTMHINNTYIHTYLHIYGFQLCVVAHVRRQRQADPYEFKASLVNKKNESRTARVTQSVSKNKNEQAKKGFLLSVHGWGSR
jgi:hypothetical protein